MRTPLERAKDSIVIDLETGCWNTTFAKNSQGYATLWTPPNKVVRLHRFMYEQIVGPIPEGMELDHLCRNRQCCNPDHLEPVTSDENTRRGDSPGAMAARTGTCKYGHSLADAILFKQTNGRGTYGRKCRTCTNQRKREAYRRKQG